MTIDLAAYRFAVITRDIIYRWERHQENPSDLRFSWDQQLDSQSLETFFNYFKSQVTPHPDFNFNPTQPEFFQSFKDFLQGEVIDNYNEVVANLPPADVMAAFDNELARRTTEVSAAEKIQPTLAQARVELFKRLDGLVSQLDSKTTELLTTVSIEALGKLDPQTALQQTAQTISEVSKTVGQAASTETLVTILESAAPYLQQTSEAFTAVAKTIEDRLEGSATQPAKDRAARLVTTAAFLGEKHAPTGLAVTPQLEAGLITATQSPHLASQVGQLLADNQLQFNQLIGQFHRASAQEKLFDQKILKELSLNPNLTGEALNQSFQIARYVTPFVMVGHSLAQEKGASSAEVRKIDEFMARIGYFDALEKGYNIRASARAAAQQALQKFDFASMFNSMGNVQTFYALRGTSSARLQAFLTDIQSLETSQFNLQTITARAGDLSLSLTTTSGGGTLPTTLKEMGQQVSQVIITNPAHSTLVWLGSQIRGGKWKNVLAGIGMGSMASFIVNPVTGVAAGIGALFIPTHYLTIESTLGTGRKVRPALAKVGRTFLAVAGSVTGVSFGFFLLIPILVALILFIINNSAYIVPQAVGTISDGIVPGDTGCFEFNTASFTNPSLLQNLIRAAQTISTYTCYNQKLCSGGKITVREIPKPVGWYGFARFSRPRLIEVYKGYQPNPQEALYTLAHESGHVFTVPDTYSVGTQYASLGLSGSDRTCLPTYQFYINGPADCRIINPNNPDQPITGQFEDEAETIADYISNLSLLSNYSNHLQLAKSIFESCGFP